MSRTAYVGSGGIGSGMLGTVAISSGEAGSEILGTVGCMSQQK